MKKKRKGKRAEGSNFEMRQTAMRGSYELWISRDVKSRAGVRMQRQVTGK